jgi:hypothetical protein
MAGGGYRGGSLLELVGADAVEAPTRRMLREVADAGGRALTEAARANTPTRTGATAAAWEQLPVRDIPEGAESGATNPSFKARLLENGVKAHTIRPKRAGAMGTPEGPRGGVEHPGVTAMHPLARAAAEVESALPAISQPAMTSWARRIEAAARREV